MRLGLDTCSQFSAISQPVPHMDRGTNWKHNFSATWKIVSRHIVLWWASFSDLSLVDERQFGVNLVVSGEETKWKCFTGVLVKMKRFLSEPYHPAWRVRWWRLQFDDTHRIDTCPITRGQTAKWILPQSTKTFFLISGIHLPERFSFGEKNTIQIAEQTLNVFPEACACMCLTVPSH